MTNFTKVSIQTKHLITEIQNKSITITDEVFITNILENNQYYRISGYWKNINKSKSTIDFSEIYRVYAMDADMRINIFNLIHVLEIKIRAIVSSISLNLPPTIKNNDPHYYLVSILFDTTQKNKKTGNAIYNDLLSKISTTVNERKLIPFIKHYRSKYTNPTEPPIWMIAEIITYGNMTTLIKLLNDRTIINFISSQFNNMTQREYNSFLYITNILRNMCAHHNRLYNNTLVSTKITIPARIKLSTSTITLWTSVVLIFYILHTHNMSNFLCSIIDTFNEIKDRYNDDLAAYGFPLDWEDRLLYYCV